MKHRTCEYRMYPDGLEEFLDGENHLSFKPKSDRKVVLEIYHDDDEMEDHQLKGIKRIEGQVSAEEVQQAVNDYLDLYCNPSNCRNNTGPFN